MAINCPIIIGCGIYEYGNPFILFGLIKPISIPKYVVFNHKRELANKLNIFPQIKGMSGNHEKLFKYKIINCK